MIVICPTCTTELHVVDERGLPRGYRRLPPHWQHGIGLRYANVNGEDVGIEVRFQCELSDALFRVRSRGDR